MGINLISASFFWHAVSLEFNLANRVADFNGLRMLELGNQHLTQDMCHFNVRSGAPGTHVAKHYFERLGINHTSIDMNGEDGSLRIDLSKPIEARFFGEFDIVTNFGTSEHVDGQRDCFSNIHQLCRRGGMMVHIVPMGNNWGWHCGYSYGHEFFDDLARINSYETVLKGEFLHHGNGPETRLVARAMKKTADSKFEMSSIRIPA